jgi:hypothetical protein
MRLDPELMHLLEKVLAAGEDVPQLVNGTDGWQTLLL